MDSKPISLRIQQIYSDYYAEQADKRFCRLSLIAINFLKELKILDHMYEFHIDEAKLDHAVLSYFLDVIRYKEYHFNPKSQENIDSVDVYSKKWSSIIHNKFLNDSKVGSFTVKWILKSSPINLVLKNTDYDPSDDEMKIATTVNERFAVICLMECLNLRFIPPKEHRSLMYDFRYRNYDEKIYFKRYDSLQKLYGGYHLDNAKSNNLKVVPSSKNQKPKSKTLQVFIASPSDVNVLRKATIEVFEEANEVSQIKSKIDKFKCWYWEDRKITEYFNNPDSDYQDNVFSEFGDHCDIFIMLLHSKIGEGTKLEFEHFEKVWQKNNPEIKFWCLHYGKNLPITSNPEKAKERLELAEWLKINEKKWSPINSVRGSVKSPKAYKKALRFLIGIMP